MQHSAEEDQRRRLRQKLKDLKSNRHRGGGAGGAHAQQQQLSNALMNDPKTAMLSMGVDDLSILDNASQIVGAAKQLSKKKSTQPTANDATRRAMETFHSESINACKTEPQSSPSFTNDNGKEHTRETNVIKDQPPLQEHGTEESRDRDNVEYDSDDEAPPPP